MPPQISPLYRLLTPLLNSFPQSSRQFPSSILKPVQNAIPSFSSRAQFSTSPTLSLSTTPNNAFSKSPTANFTASSKISAPPGQQRNKIDPRITMIRYHLNHPLTPRPLRFSRMRALRHWTIHRAWMLMRRKEGDRLERELERQYQSMHSACEYLRNMDPAGQKDSGRLYRIAMLKRGVFRAGGVPIEYARAQVERPGKSAWNHGWTR